MDRVCMTAVALAATVLGGCFDREDEYVGSFGGGGSSSIAPVYQVPGSPPAECDIGDSKWNRMTDTYVATEQSVHELITCGQAQVGVAQSVLALLVASNRDLFRGDAFETLSGQAATLGLYLDMPLDPKENGEWTMPIATAGDGSTFAITMYEPGGRDPILPNPFAIDSYVHVTYVDNEWGVDAMLDDWSLRNTLSFHWDGEGPLAHLIQNAEEAIPNPIVVRFSIEDMLAFVWPHFADEGDAPDFGPLDAILDLEMTSCIELNDQRGSVSIDYHVDGRRRVVRNIATSSAIPFDVHGIGATDGSLHLESTAAELGYAGNGGLAGTIDYRIADDRDAVKAVSDFGAGQAYPTSDWSCEGL